MRPPLSLEEFQVEVQRDDSVEHVNLLLQRHCKHCTKGCNDVAPPQTGKVPKWSKKTDRCQIYKEYTRNDGVEYTRCREGKGMNQLVEQLTPSSKASRRPDDYL